MSRLSLAPVEASPADSPRADHRSARFVATRAGLGLSAVVHTALLAVSVELAGALTA